jgi:hypothetical protein
MRPWKMSLGLGAACAACCAIPLLGVAGGLATFASALWACADEFIPATVWLAAVAVGFAALWWWRKRRSVPASPCGCSTSCSTGASHAQP